jgi:tRNA(Arg) A34 adenosine deaminase TadA
MRREFSFAIAAAWRSNQKYRIGAAIFDKRGCFLAEGHNKKKTHPLQKLYAAENGSPEKCYLHAELSALISLNYTDAPYSIYVARLSNVGTALARPCPICYAAITERGIKEINYTTNEGTIERETIG